MQRVLLVDNARVTGKSQKIPLEMSGFEVIEETDIGPDVVETYQKILPDVVIIEISLPAADGIELLKALKKVDKDAKVIMIAPLDEGRFVSEALAAGAVSVIKKSAFKE